MAGGKHILGKGNSKRTFGTAKVGDRGQIVIPKGARDLFDIQPGDTLLLMADINRGIAIVRNDNMKVFIENFMNVQEEE